MAVRDGKLSAFRGATLIQALCFTARSLLFFLNAETTGAIFLVPAKQVSSQNPVPGSLSAGEDPLWSVDVLLLLHASNAFIRYDFKGVSQMEYTYHTSSCC